MISAAALYAQVKDLFRLVSTAYVLILLALLILVVVHLQTGIPIAYLTRDSSAAEEAPFYTGLYSNIGVLFWCSTAAVCLFSVGILKYGSNSPALKRFLFYSGLFTTFMLFDDFFLLHEEVLPEYIGIPQKFVYVLYTGVSALYLIRFRTFILRTQFLPLLFAFGFFSLSIAVDVIDALHDLHITVFGLSLATHHLLEDGFKLFGIVSWSLYFIKLCLDRIQPLLNLPTQRPDSAL